MYHFRSQVQGISMQVKPGNEQPRCQIALPHPPQGQFHPASLLTTDSTCRGDQMHCRSGHRKSKARIEHQSLSTQSRQSKYSPSKVKDYSDAMCWSFITLLLLSALYVRRQFLSPACCPQCSLLSSSFSFLCCPSSWLVYLAFFCIFRLQQAVAQHGVPDLYTQLHFPKAAQTILFYFKNGLDGT